LSQFQALKCDREGMTRLLRILNERMEQPRSDDDLDSRLEAVWPSFLEHIQETTEATMGEPVASLQSADLRIRMGMLGAWKEEQIIIENVGLGVAENIEVLADDEPIRDASFAIRNQELVPRLRPGEEFGVKIALSMGDPERTEIMVRWQDKDGRQRSTERLVTLL
ncbi:MAG TPA: hypothetical protein VM778_08640, partial [Gemmatimonadota bacterium]|nr:hypothetical protein [Gemmatimonadota bacterium]